MARALLQIDVDTSSVQRAFGVMRTAARAAGAAMSAEMRNSAREATRAARQQEAEARRAAAAVVKAARDAEKAKTRAAETEAKNRQRTADREAREFARAVDRRAADFARAERTVTAQAEQYARRREQAATREANTKIREARRAAREAEREAARVTRETNARGMRIASGLGAAMSGVGSYASAIHGDVQSARERRAATEHTLNSALYQVGGVTPAMAREIRAQVQGFAQRTGISSESIIAGMSASQTQFNTLAPQSGETIRDSVQRQLELAQFAASTYQDPGEVMRVAGMLGQQGIRGADQSSMLRSLTGMAQAGAIELSNVSSEALGPMMGNIARVTNPNMTAEQRSAAVQSATSQSFAVAEVARAAGLSATQSLNALAKTRQTLVSPDRAASLYNRLHRAGRDDLAGELLQDDGHGHRTFRDTDPVQFMSRLLAGFHGDAAAAINVTSGIGHGLGAQVLNSAQTNLFAKLASQTQGGHSIADTVNGLAQRGAELTPQRIAEGEALRRSEQSTELTRASEAHESALTDNTSAIVNLSNQFGAWATANPMQATALTTGTGAAVSALGPTAARAAAPLLGRLGAMLGLGGSFASRAVPLAGIAVTAATAANDLQQGRSFGQTALNAAADILPGGGALHGLGGRGAADIVRRTAPGGATQVELSDGSVNRLAGAIARQQITATVSPVDAAHAAATAATARGR